MSEEEPGEQSEERSRKPGAKSLVADGAARRPFMRGIMVHSLLGKGMSFEEAYRVASSVRERLRSRPVVTRDELRALVGEVAGPAALAEARPEPARGSDIVVTARGRGAPFSKGFLSQSLLAAAIDPTRAFEVAREIEEDLLRRGVREIDRHELRRLAYRAIHERVGAQAAERFLVWRRYQDPDKPVILLLGGATGAGKTALAQEVAHRLGIAGLVSTDSIRQIMRIMLSKDLVPAIHASSYDAWRALPDAASLEDPVVEGFRTMAATVSVGVRAMIDRAVAENASLIIDGVSLVPGLIDFASYHDRAHVIFLIVATLDPEAFAGRFAARAREAAERPPHRYLENLDAILRIQDYLLELAEQHGVPIVDNVSFDRSVTSIIRHVTETLRKQGDFDAAALLSSAVALLALAGALGCATISPQEESRLGAQLHEQLRREAYLLDDRVVQGYVADLGQRIAAAAGGGELDYRFFVVVDDQINAFAAPGGYVYVNTGTIQRARNVSELAGVLAHEIGHVARRHLAENLGRRRTVDTARQLGVVAAAVAAGPAGASAANLLGGLASLAALNSFGREAEREADVFAVEVLPEAGYDPEGLVSFFQTLLRERSETPSGSFLSDHPATEERIAETRHMIDEAKLPAALRSDDGGRLEIIQRRIEILTGAAGPEAPR